MKKIIILRGVSGNGKSFLTEHLCANSMGAFQVCADNYFYDSFGNYNFDASKLGEAHKECKRRFLEYLHNELVTTIIVANTNTKESDWKFYEEEAKKAGADVIFLVVENRHGNTNQHKVPEETLQRQEQNIRNSLKLR